MATLNNSYVLTSERSVWYNKMEYKRCHKQQSIKLKTFIRIFLNPLRARSFCTIL